MGRNIIAQNKKHVTLAVVLTTFARLSVNHFVLRRGCRTATHRSVDIVNNKTVAVATMKFTKNSSRSTTADDSDFSVERCPLRIFKTPVNGRTVIPAKRCAIVNAMLKTFVGLLKHFRGSLLTT